jgi:hypothetical protein
MLLFAFLHAASAGTAVVELFTSEGCSSCPPADALLSELAAEETPGVILLELHVDYWDRLGWPDPWADKQFSDRQRRYGERFDQVYTPQMVVNGEAQFVGSDRLLARALIAKALAAPQSALSVDARREGQTIRATVAGAPHGTALVATIVEDGLSSDVARGENRGSKLRHDRVARAWVEGPGPSIAVRVPAGIDPAKARLVVFAQEPKSLRIVGAAEQRLP